MLEEEECNNYYKMFLQAFLRYQNHFYGTLEVAGCIWSKGTKYIALNMALANDRHLHVLIFVICRVGTRNAWFRSF